MRKLTYAAVALVALVVTSLAVAHGIEGAKSAKAVAATFTAAPVSTSSRTCTTTDGKTIVVTDGKYAGAAAGDTDLTGPITLRARSVINTTDNVGVVNGRFAVDVAGGRNTEGAYSAVYSQGTLAGLAVGKAHQPNAKLLANLSATFSATAPGFTDGKLGGGTAGGAAVELGPGSCKPAHSTSEHSEASGVATLSSNTIVVAGLSCTIPADKVADVNAKFHTGDTVHIRCSFVGGVNTLTKIEKKH